MGRKSFESKGLISEEKVRELYEVQSLGVRTAAAQLGISVGTFYKYLNKYGITRRTRGSRASL